MEICKGCEHIDVSGEKCMVPGTNPCCGLCGCSLSLKTRSLSSSCDVEKWKAILTEEEDDELTKSLE